MAKDGGSEFRFEKLDVWCKAMEWVDEIYSFTRKFPDEEKFGLTSQFRRSSVSVVSNIAEGSGRSSDRDFAHFLEIAYGSLMESICQCIVAFRQGYLSGDEFNRLYSTAQRLARMLSGLRAYLDKGRETKVEGRGTRDKGRKIRPSTLDP